MLRYVSAFAVAVLATMATSPASAIHKGPCHGAGCDGGGEPPPGATLESLDCSVEGQVAKIVSGAWECAADSDILADLPSCIDGDVAKFDGTDWYCASSALSPPSPVLNSARPTVA